MNRLCAGLALAALAAAVAAPAPRARAAGPTPTIASVSPSRGPVAGGTTVTITGTDFAAPMTVTFGGQPATSVVVVSPTSLTCLTPGHARGDVDVIVTQTTPPETPSAPAVAAYAYDEPSYYAWIPRAPGSLTGGNPGGFDVTVVDLPNRRVVAEIDLNPADTALPTDDDWSVTQVLFDASGATAFLATSGTPGARDSKKVFVVDTALALDSNPANDVLSTIDTNGNPYQLALSSNGNTLYVADGGPWATGVIGDGSLRAYNVTNRAAPVLPGTFATVGKIPVLAWDGSTQRGWGKNSSHLGRLQVVDGRTVVTNALSRSLSVVVLSSMTAAPAVDVAGGLSGAITTSVPSPYEDDFLLVETADPTSLEAAYFVFRVSTSTLVPKGAPAIPVGFFSLSLLPVPRLDLQNRRSWPHPDGESLLALPLDDPSVATLRAATGAVQEKAAIVGGGPPTNAAWNDATGFLYAREADGGWTVYTVPEGRGKAAVKSVEIPDATGIDSLRVVGDGSLLAGTRTSTLALIDGKATSTDLHKVIATVALGLDPAGGPLFPQPGNNGGAARVFVEIEGAPGAPAVVFPQDGELFCADDDPPEFTITTPNSGAIRYELEIGSQYDFLVVPGAWRFRVRVPFGSTTATPPAGPWRRVLRHAAGGVERPFFARANAVFRDGTRLHGSVTSLRVCEPDPPTATAPAPAASADRDVPPQFSFAPGDAGRFWIEFAHADGFDAGVLARVRVKGVVSGPASATPSRAAWRRIVDRVRGRDGTYPVIVEWRVRCVDLLRREVVSAERALVVSE